MEKKPLGRPRKRPLAFTCRCLLSHKSMMECEQSAKRETHMKIGTRVIVVSPMVTIWVGSDSQNLQFFNVHKDLLTLHSKYFLNRLNAYQGPLEEDQKICISIPPFQFAHFVSYLYTGWFMELPKRSTDAAINACNLWAIGDFFKSPGFQNLCLEFIREYCKFISLEGDWPTPHGVEITYIVTKKGSKLRKLAAHCMAWKGPFELYDQDSEKYEEWDQLLEKYPDLAVDVSRAAGKRWNGTRPWDDEHRGAYLENETDLEEALKQQILREKSRGQLEELAEGGSFESIIKLKTLEGDVNVADTEPGKEGDPGKGAEDSDIEIIEKEPDATKSGTNERADTSHENNTTSQPEDDLRANHRGSQDGKSSEQLSSLLPTIQHQKPYSIQTKQTSGQNFNTTVIENSGIGGSKQASTKNMENIRNERQAPEQCEKETNTRSLGRKWPAAQRYFSQASSLFPQYYNDKEIQSVNTSKGSSATQKAQAPNQSQTIELDSQGEKSISEMAARILGVTQESDGRNAGQPISSNSSKDNQLQSPSTNNIEAPSSNSNPPQGLSKSKKRKKTKHAKHDSEEREPKRRKMSNLSKKRHSQSQPSSAEKAKASKTPPKINTQQGAPKQATRESSSSLSPLGSSPEWSEDERMMADSARGV